MASLESVLYRTGGRTCKSLDRIEDMARGWESKSVEEQMAGRDQPVPVMEGAMFKNEEARRKAERERMTQTRRKQTLEMQRENILSQRTSNAGRRAALEAALKEIEAELAELG